MAETKNQIKLGYEAGSGNIAYIPFSHLIVTGVTQLSGKTTTLEALIKRSGQKAIVFKTKIGEKSFSEGTAVPPFFRDRSDYEFVKSLMEAYNREKLSIERGTLMNLCKGSKDLIEIKQRVDNRLNPADPKTKPLTGINYEIYTRLEHYLGQLIPQIKYASLSSILNLPGQVNIMNLESFSEEAQSLIIQSTLDEVLKNYNNITIVIPEAWKFIPQKYNNPCKRSVEAFIRQGATNHNYIWVDSQDMSGVDKIPLKSISTWILGYQSERNEVKHTLDQISLPKKSKPKEEEIMGLRKGMFYVSSYDGVKKVYVQPIWLEDKIAQEVAEGVTDSDEVQFIKDKWQPNEAKPAENLPIVHKPMTFPGITSMPNLHNNMAKAGMTDDDRKWVVKELTEIRDDFFAKIKEIIEHINAVNQHLFEINEKHSNIKIPEINIDEIVNKVLQKMPTGITAGAVSTGAGIDKESLIREVLARVPKIAGGVVYEVSPLEKLKKDFLQEAKERIYADISGLNDEIKKSIKYLEVLGRKTSKSEIFKNGLGNKGGYPGGGAFDKGINEAVKLGLIKKDSKGAFMPALEDRIVVECQNFGISDDEVQQVYDHIMMEMLGEGVKK